MLYEYIEQGEMTGCTWGTEKMAINRVFWKLQSKQTGTNRENTFPLLTSFMYSHLRCLFVKMAGNGFSGRKWGFEVDSISL